MTNCVLCGKSLDQGFVYFGPCDQLVHIGCVIRSDFAQAEESHESCHASTTRETGCTPQPDLECTREEIVETSSENVTCLETAVAECSLNPPAQPGIVCPIPGMQIGKLIRPDGTEETVNECKLM